MLPKGLVLTLISAHLRDAVLEESLWFACGDISPTTKKILVSDITINVSNGVLEGSRWVRVGYE